MELTFYSSFWCGTGQWPLICLISYMFKIFKDKKINANTKLFGLNNKTVDAKRTFFRKKLVEIL